MFYQILLAVGGLGLLVQAALGLSHSDGDSGHVGHGDHTHTDNDGHEAGHSWLLLLSPLRLFGLCVGVGAAGLALQSLKTLSPGLILALALLAGVAFYQLVIKSLMALVLRFASKPAATLSGALGQEATADSRFDEQGQGIVTLVVDGHLVRLLATLEGVHQSVEAGEKLVVIEINTKRNRAKVTKL